MRVRWVVQAEYSTCSEGAEKDLRQLLTRFEEVHAEAGAKVARWCKQTRRMENDMTKLVHIKTKALEDKKTLQVCAVLLSCIYAYITYECVLTHTYKKTMHVCVVIMFCMHTSCKQA